MDILSWNCRGICNSTTTIALHDLIAQNQPQIVFLCETKISQIGNFKDLHRELGFAHYKEVLSDGQYGGLGVFWTDDIVLWVRTFSAHHIDMEVSSGPGEPRWRLTGFYGYARTSELDLSWQLIRDLCDLDSLPWVIIGDLNEILNNGEKTGGPIRPERQMRGFREALGYSELIDLGFQGAKMTLWNSETQLRLDRAVATASWSDGFGHSRVQILAPSDSDHTLILLQASSVPLPKRPRRHRFKFESFWLQHEECDPLVLDKWQTDFEGVLMYALTRKIICTRRALETWQQQTFRFQQQQMFEVRGRLEFLMGQQLSVELHDEKKNLIASLQDLLSQEEAFWKQRAKVTWLQEGDRNSGFFHMKATNRKRKNSLLGSSLDSEAVEFTLAAIKPCVTEEMNQSLCEQYTEEEVQYALFQMYPTKSPGPDESMGDLRPIALCNVIYKLRSKVIANRLKVFLPALISPFQSAFVPGRLITDNILVANEVAHFVHNKRQGQDGYMALNLDLSKAYDRMEWTFLRKLLLRFGFAPVWIEVVMQCVTSVRYSFLVRGKPRGYVIPSRGLRQGDPLSPYLFLLGAEGFSNFLQQKQELGGMEIVDSHERYLGLPTYVGRKKTTTFEYIKEMLGEKLKLWQGKLLSGAAWRVVSNPESLVAQLYKARYYPEGDFWNATAHASPSYSWSSIFATRDFIQTGAFWQVGNGHNVSVWNDAWIPKLPAHKPLGALVSQHNVNMVDELITPPSNWNESKVRSIFTPEDVEAILAIPLSSRQPEDRLTWHFERKGMFTVKSAYHFAFSKNASTLPPSVMANQAAIGFLVRDANGNFVSAIGKPVIFETDCLVLQQQLTQARTPNTSFLGRLYEDIGDDLSLMVSSRIVHVRREANKAAHALADYASAQDQNFFFLSVPSFIHTVIGAEKHVP
ncbi:uncharacterized protein LOC112169623 [Rosa chinensis]|uniref:uncharacterized protein LOC112169623 n=1 Tax=Rosa chinensis TaxID=74649 RepID=UPI000D090631|nr:uncharacterized protein LOC112169623 [Rosa chinensis]